MNKVPFRKNIPIIAKSTKEYEALVRYIKAREDDKSWKFTFHISGPDKDGKKKIKVAIEEFLV